MKIASDHVQWLWDLDAKKNIKESKTIESLIQSANSALLQRARICLHETPESSAQCMLINLSQGSYLPIHRHQAGNESYLLISGKITLIVFSDLMQVMDIKKISTIDTGGIMNVRIIGVSSGVFHTLISETANSTYMEFRDAPHGLDDHFIDLAHGAEKVDALKCLSSLNVGECPDKKNI